MNEEHTATDEHTATVDAPDLDHVQILGLIGVGKSTLCQDARSTRAVFQEYVNDSHLGTYIKAPQYQAYGFQVAMMQGACVRTMDAECVLYDSRQHNRAPFGVAVERPAQENVIFARANGLCGHFSSNQYADYCRYMVKWSEDLNAHRLRFGNAAKLPCCIKLHAPEFKTAMNMIERGRLYEDGYKDRYMCTLAHTDFVAYIELMMMHRLCAFERPLDQSEHESEVEKMMQKRFSLAESICPIARVPIVVDWANYGTWNALMDHLTVNVVNWNAEPGHVKFVFKTPDDDAKLLFDKTTHMRTHVLRDTPTHSYFDLSWYITLYTDDVTNKLLGTFRDLFFQARAACQDVTFVVSRHHFDTRFFLDVYKNYKEQ